MTVLPYVLRDGALSPAVVRRAPAATSSVTLTVPAGAVASTLTDFVTRVDLSTMPAEWWDGVAGDGGNIRVKRSGAVIPFDLVAVAPALAVGELFFKATLIAEGDNVFTLDKTGDGLLAATDPNGRNAVWSDYDAVFMFPGGLVNRTGSGADVVVDGDPFAYMPDVNVPSVPATDKQGIAGDGEGNFYITTTTAIYKYDAAWNLLITKTTALTDTGIADVNHLGDCCVHDGELYVPVENWTGGVGTIQHIGVWNLDTLAFKRAYDVSANGHEVAAICFNPDDGLFYVADFTSPGESVLHKYDTSFNHQGTLALAAPVPGKNGLDYYDGWFTMTSSISISEVRIYRVSGDGSTVALTWLSGDSEIEGVHVDKTDGTLYQLFKDTSPAAIRIFRPTDWLGSGRVASASATGLPKRTSWTMGATAVTAGFERRNRGLLSYGSNSTSSTDRASLLIRGSLNASRDWATWNSTDTYMEAGEGARPYGWRGRVHHIQNGATSRSLAINGSVVNTGISAQRPGGVGDTLFILAESQTRNERFVGVTNYVYLRNGTLSADWLAAEYASWETPGSFYTVV